jgi:hypothetical protein
MSHDLIITFPFPWPMQPADDISTCRPTEGGHENNTQKPFQVKHSEASYSGLAGSIGAASSRRISRRRSKRPHTLEGKRYGQRALPMARGSEAKRGCFSHVRTLVSEGPCIYDGLTAGRVSESRPPLLADGCSTLRRRSSARGLHGRQGHVSTDITHSAKVWT